MLIPFQDLTLLYMYNISIPRGIVHIGASTGQEAEAYSRQSIEKVVWVEAIPEVFEKLKDNIKQYPKHKALNACISDKNGEVVEFNISSNDGESSSFLEFGTHAIAHPDVKVVEKRKMTTIRMDTLIEDNHIDISDYDFLNIDLQGCELLALKSFGSLLRYFKYVYIEVNEKELYKGCALLPEVQDYLESFGFYLKKIKMAGDTGWGDAFFIKGSRIHPHDYIKGMLDLLNVFHWKVPAEMLPLSGYASDILTSEKRPLLIKFDDHNERYVLIEL